jgi:hypothetical protein
VPTASAVLAWTYPARFGVIDRWAWATLHFFNCVPRETQGKTSFSIEDWSLYDERLQEIQNLLRDRHSIFRSPQEIDLWLYHYDKRVRSHALADPT